MKKIVFTSFLVFVFLFSYGNFARAESSTESNMLQSIYNQIEAIRATLGGLASSATTAAIITPAAPTTALTYCTGVVVNNVCQGNIVSEIECKNHPNDCSTWTIMNRVAAPVDPSVVGVRADDSKASLSVETLRPGARGDNVLAIQKLLQSNGYYAGVLDGIYGPGMTSAVSAFQKAKGLMADGILGPKTLASFYGTSWTKDAVSSDVAVKSKTLDKPVTISVFSISGWYNGQCVRGEFRPDGTWTVYQFATGCTSASPVFL